MNTKNSGQHLFPYMLRCTLLLLFILIPLIAVGETAEEDFQKCSELFSKNQALKAGECFIVLVETYPKHTLVNKALYNGAIAFEQGGERQQAITLKERLLKEFPKGEHAEDCLFSLATAYQVVADYSNAAKLFERHAQNYPKSKNGEDVLITAAVIYHRLGKLNKAIELYKLYIKRFKRTKEAPHIFFTIGIIYEEQKNYKKAKKQFSAYLKKWSKKGPQEKIVEAHTHKGLAQMELGNTKKAYKEFKAAVKSYNNLRPESLKQSFSATHSAAQAQFLLAIQDVEAFEKKKLGNIKKLKKTLKEKIELLQTAEKKLRKVINFKNIKWTTAAIYQIGMLYITLAREIREIPLPKNHEENDIYVESVNDIVAPIEDKAIDYFKSCLQIGSYNDYVLLAIGALRDLNPEMVIHEKFPEPGFIQEGTLNDFSGTVETGGQQLLKNYEDQETIRNLVLAYLKEDNQGVASLLGTSGLLTNSQHADLNNAMGLVALSEGNADMAVNYFSRAVQIDPNHLPALLNLGALALQYHNTEQAFSSLSKAYDTAPNSIPVLLMNGIVQRLKELPGQTMTNYEKILQQDPNHIQTLFNMAILCQDSLRDDKRAEELFRTLLQLEKKDQELIKEINERLEVLKMLKEMKKQLNR